MGAMHSTTKIAAHGRPTVARSNQRAAASPPPALLDMDDATARLVVAVELEGTRCFQDDSNGTSDYAMARRIAIDQLLSCRALNQIEEMTDAELAHAMSPPPSATDTCTVCVESPTAGKAWRTPCQHWYCLDCLETLIRASVTDESLYPPKCCVVVPWDELRALLPADLATSFGQRKAELDILAGESLYCAEPSCSHFLGTRATRAGGIDCSLCHTVTCATCRAVSHAGPCPAEADEAEQQTLRLANEQGWQSCQQCKRVVERVPGGCNHMNCLCGYQFCYTCGARWQTCDCRWHGDLDYDALEDGVLNDGVLDPGVNAHQSIRFHVHAHLDVTAALNRYREALDDIEVRLEQLHEAEEAIAQAGRNLWQILQARRAQ
jgi:hypothetical protein